MKEKHLTSKPEPGDAAIRCDGGIANGQVVSVGSDEVVIQWSDQTTVTIHSQNDNSYETLSPDLAPLIFPV